MVLSINTYARKMNASFGVFPEEDPNPKPTFLARATNAAKAEWRSRQHDEDGEDGGDEDDMEEDGEWVGDVRHDGDGDGDGGERPPQPRRPDKGDDGDEGVRRKPLLESFWRRGMS
jgi:hypothetical protein